MNRDFVLGAKITADSAELRQALQSAINELDKFGESAQRASKKAGQGTDEAARKSEDSANRQVRANKRTKDQVDKTGDGFEEYRRKATKAYEDSARGAEDSSRRQESAFRGALGSLAKLTGAAGLGLLAKQVWDTGIGFHEFQQNANIAFETLLGGAEKGRAALADILEFAKETPYAFTDLTEEAQKLVSAGFDMEQVIPIMRATGDAATAMGRGTEGMERLNRAFGQIQGKGRLQTEELLQMSELGVNGLKILANQAGMTTLEYQKLVTAGMVPAEEAIAGLIQGINEGTDGVNGQTAAMGGLMDRIKNSGGLTATLDSAKSGFRNMSAELTENLVPAYTSLLRTMTQGMGVIKNVAGWFNDLPGPIQATAVMLGVLLIAQRQFDIQAKSSAGWSTLRTNLTATRAQYQALSLDVGRARAAMMTLASAGTGISRIGGAMLGAFGGPVGLAITGVTLGVSAFAQSQADAAERVRALSDLINIQTGELEKSESAFSNIEGALNKPVNNWWTGFWDGSGSGTLTEWAERMGVSLQDLTAAWGGNEEAIRRVRETVEEFDTAEAGGNWYDKRGRFLEELTKREEELADAQELATTKSKLREAQEGATQAAIESTTVATDSARSAMIQWTEEQEKAIDKAAEAAEALLISYGSVTRDLDVATEDDYAAALKRVEDANRKVRDAEDSLAETRKREKTSHNDILRAEEAVADAREAAVKANEDLEDVESRRDPVEQYRKKLEEMTSSAEKFTEDMRALAESGLNAQSLQELLAAGPEGSLEAREALLSDVTLIDAENQARLDMADYAAELGVLGGVIQMDMEQGGQNIGGWINQGVTAKLEADAHETLEAFLTALGTDYTGAKELGWKLGQSVLEGFLSTGPYSMMGDHYRSIYDPNYSSTGYWTGGVLPGYTPGRDIYSVTSNLGRFRFSGGEAIMRPEIPAAMGKAWVDRINGLAMSGGVAAVRRELGGMGRGYATGGVLPSVVTVPVESTHTTNDGPINIGQVMLQDVDELRRWSRSQRGTRAWGGRRG